MKKLFAFLLLGVFLISFTSAAEWDNGISDYWEDEELITFKNGCALGICVGDVIGQVQLKTPKNFKVGAGYNYVWEMDAWVYEDYNDFLKGFEFENLNNGKEKINRDIDIKILSYEEIEVEDYIYESCYENGYINPTCNRIENGTHMEQREVWKKVTPADIKKSEGKITLRGYTNVKRGDYVDWSPVIFGVRVGHDIWATWEQVVNDDFSSDTLSSYTTTGTVTYNIGTQDVTVGSAGSAERGTMTRGNFTEENFTIDFNCAAGGYQAILFQTDNNLHTTTGSGYMIGIGTNWGEMDLYKTTAGFNGRGTALATATGYNMLGSTDYNLQITHIDNNITIILRTKSDEVIRAVISINDSDYAYGYHGAYSWDDPLTIDNYIISEQTSGTPPSVVLISPEDNANLTSSNVQLITTVTDDQQVSNVTLYIDGVANETNSSGIEGNYTFSKTLALGYHNWSILALNNQSLSNQSETWFFNYTGQAPSVILTSPMNDSFLTSANVDFISQVTDDEAIENVTLYLDGVANETNSSGYNGTYTFSKMIAQGIHNWSILAFDDMGLLNQSETWIFNYTQPGIFIDLTSPADVSTHESPPVNMSCNAYEEIGVTQLNLTINGVTNITVENTTIAENLSISETINFAEGDYNWSCSAMNPSTSSQSSNRSFTVDYADSDITLFYPSNDSTFSSDAASFIFNASNINGLDNVTLYIDGVANETNSSGIEGNYTFDISLGEGSYTWHVLAVSSLGTQTNSSFRVFTVDYADSDITLFIPENDSSIDDPSVDFIFNASNINGLDNVTLYLDGVANETNSSGIEGNYTFTKTFGEGNYTWYVQAVSSLGTKTNSTERVFEILFSSPEIILDAPANNTNFLTKDINFTFNASDTNGLENVTLYIDGIANETNSSGISGSYEFNKIITNDINNWSVRAVSILGKITNSVTRFFTIHIGPVVNITAPSGIIDIFHDGDNETLIYNISEAGFNDTHFDECWFEYPVGLDSICYQESANVYNQSGIDGNCDLNYSGSVGFNLDWSGQGGGNPFLMADGDFNTGTPNQRLFINYTKPNNYDTTSIWMVKDFMVGSVENLTINSSCWTAYDDKIVLKGITTGSGFNKFSTFQCHNSTDWITVASFGIGEVTNWIYEEAMIWNITTTVEINCSENTTSFTYIEGKNNLTVFAKDVLGLIGNATTTWSYGMLVKGIEFSETVREGTVEEFKINVTIDSSLSGISLLLNYEGVNYTMSSTSTGLEREYTVEIVIPEVSGETNNTFFFIGLLSSGDDITQVETDSNNQTVLPFLIDDCSTFNQTLLQFTMVDEDTLDEIDGTIEFTINIFAFESSDVIKVFNDSYDYVIGEDSKVCLEDLTEQYSMSYEIRHFGEESQYFKKYRNIQLKTINNDTIPDNLTLYNLNLSRGNAFNIIVVGNLISSNGNIGLLVDTQRQYLATDEFISVESPVTDSGGVASSNLVQTEEIYNFLISFNGELLGTFNNYQVKCANAALGQCSITLNLASATGTPTDFETVGNITQVFLLDENTNTLHHTFSSTDGSSKTVRSLVIKDTGYANETICDSSSSGTSGVILCAIPTQYQNVSIIVQTFVEEQMIGSRFFSQGVSPDWQGADILIMLLMFSSLVLLMIAHPITIIIGAILGLTMPVLLISVAGASFGTLIGATFFYIAGGIIAIIVIRKKKF